MVVACGLDDNTEQFRKDVLWCEDAVAKLTSCCDGLSGSSANVASIPCRAFSSGCDTLNDVVIDPYLSRDESECVRQASCSDLRDNGVCERAGALVAPVDAGPSPLPTVGIVQTHLPPPHALVCP